MSERDDLVSSAVEGKPQSVSGWRRGPCPFCLLKLGKEDRKNCLGVHASGAFHCFRCAVRGRLSNVELPDDEVFDGADDDWTTGEPESFEPIYSGEGLDALCLEPARAYLEKRKIPPRALRWSRVGFCFSGRYRNRVVFPVLRAGDARWRGFVARSILKGAERPYLYAKDMPRGTYFYGEEFLAEDTATPIVVVEGVIDALALWPDAVAVLGKPSEAQVQKLLAAPRPIAVAFDPDAYGEAQALVSELRIKGQRAGAVRLPLGHDPDEVAPEWLRAEALKSLEG